MERPHLLAGGNIGLITVRQVAEGVFNHAFATKSVVECRITISNKGAGFVFPLYLYRDPTQLFNTSPWPEGKDGRTPNLNPNFVQNFAQKLGLTFITEGQGDLQNSFGPEDVFYYIYAIFHSPTYRTRYAQFLKIDFPRVPLTHDRELFAALVKLGHELVKLHLLEQVPSSPVSFPVRGDDEVAKAHPKYNQAAQRVYVNKTQYFEGVEPEVWEFYVGGYQVLEKWLKDRQGRRLTYNDLTHYRKIVAAIKRTIELMAEIDETIPDWPIQ